MIIEIPDSLISNNPAVANLATAVQALTPKASPGERQSIETTAADWDFSQSAKAMGIASLNPVFDAKWAAERRVDMTIREGTTSRLFRVRLSDGTGRLMKAVYNPGAAKSQSQNAPGSPVTQLPVTQPTVASYDTDLALTCHAAFAINGRLESNTTVKAFYTEAWQKGRAHCHAQVMPLLAREPFTAGMDGVGRLLHVRNLIALNLAPNPAVSEAVSKSLAEKFRVDQFEDLQIAGKFEESFEFASEDLRRQFADAKTYAYFRRAELRGAVRYTERAGQIHRYTAADFRTPPKAAVAPREDRFEVEWRGSKSLQREFPSAGCYAAYRRRMG